MKPEHWPTSWEYRPALARDLEVGHFCWMGPPHQSFFVEVLNIERRYPDVELYLRFEDCSSGWHEFPSRSTVFIILDEAEIPL